LFLLLQLLLLFSAWVFLLCPCCRLLLLLLLCLWPCQLPLIPLSPTAWGSLLPAASTPPFGLLCVPLLLLLLLLLWSCKLQASANPHKKPRAPVGLVGVVCMCAWSSPCRQLQQPWQQQRPW
jgi:hypothetical protein